MKSIFVRPHITEKTLTLAASGWYTFVVDRDADKGAIARAIADFYTVKVVGVRVSSMHGKIRRVGKLMRPAQKSDWKKAMVRLDKGQKIDAFEVIGKEERKSV